MSNATKTRIEIIRDAVALCYGLSPNSPEAEKILHGVDFTGYYPLVENGKLTGVVDADDDRYVVDPTNSYCYCLAEAVRLGYDTESLSW